MSSKITFEDYLAFQNLDYLVATSQDLKDYDQLRKIALPSLKIDFSSFGRTNSQNMTMDEYEAMVQASHFDGDETMKHHFHLGGAYYEKTSAADAFGRRQVVATFVVHTDAKHSAVETTAINHAIREMYYKKVDGEWKWAGQKTNIHIFGDGYERVSIVKTMPAKREHWHIVGQWIKFPLHNGSVYVWTS